MSFRCCGKHIQCSRECGASGSATAASTSGPCAKESCGTPILWRSNQQVNYLTLRRVPRYLSASGSDLPKTTVPCQAGHANPGVGWSKPRTAHGSRDGIADATKAPCGLNEDMVAPRTSVQMLVLSAACPTSWPCCQGRDRYQLRVRRNLFAATVSKSTATAPPAPVVKYIQPAPTFQTAPAKLHDMNRDGIPDVLQQSQVGYSVPLPYGFYICALVHIKFAKMSKSPRITTRCWLLCTPISFFFPCFYMLSFALSDVYRELMWPWWRERNFSSPTRSSSSSELGPETGVCLELDVKLSAAMVTLAVACCQQVIWENPQPRLRCRLVWGSSVHHYIDCRNVCDLHNNNLVNRSIKL